MTWAWLPFIESRRGDRFHHIILPQGGWGPVRVVARSGLGPKWALMGPPGQVLAGLDMSDFRLLVEFPHFGFKNRFLTKLIDDSAWFLLEKLKKHVILTKNLNILTKN